MLNLSLYIQLKNVQTPPSLNSCGTKSLVKLGSCRPNFKITLEERPSEKSCSTSFFQSVNDKVKKVSILFFHVNLFLAVTQLRNISGLANKSPVGFKFGFDIFEMLVQIQPRGQAFFTHIRIQGDSFRPKSKTGIIMRTTYESLGSIDAMVVVDWLASGFCEIWRYIR